MATIDDIINGSFNAIGLPTFRSGMMGRGLPTDRLIPGTAGIDPIGWTPPASPDPALAYAPAAPVNPALAATSSFANPITNVTASMKPQSGGGLLDLIFGPSKNGLSGLPGLMGGPQQGGILQMLFGGGQNTSGLPRMASSQTRSVPTRVTGDALVARASGATSSAEANAWRKKTFGGDGRSLV